MKRFLYSVLCLLLVCVCLSGCKKQEKQGSEEATVPTLTEVIHETEINNTIELVEVETISKIDMYFDENASKYDLDSKSLDTVKTIYNQLSDYWSFQNEETKKYSRIPLDLCEVWFVYNGKSFILGCEYAVQTSEVVLIYNTLNIREDGYLEECYFDIKPYINEFKDHYNFQTENGVVVYCVVNKNISEDININSLCAGYAQYLQSRQEKYGDLDSMTYTAVNNLSSNENKMLNNILNSKSVWEYYYDSWNQESSPCVLLNIWSFDDGTAEILCKHGLVEMNGNQCRVTTHGYAVNETGAEELGANETERLNNDIGSSRFLEWSVDWKEEFKQEKLAEFILSLK